jgi:preprotein translocase subunit SecD
MHTNGKPYWLVFIVIVVALSLWIIQSKPTKLGLDLSGGVRFTLQAKPTEVVPAITPTIMTTLQGVIDHRVNPTGTEENLVQKVGENRILVEIPGAKDPEQAKSVLGKTGNLEFKALDAQTQKWVSTGLSGKDLDSSLAAPDTKPGSWKIDLRFNADGGKKFFEITRKLAPLHAQLGIFFDGELQSAPNVNEAITGGSAVITGSFTKEKAQGIVDILNAGALPVDIEIIEESSVGPLLGLASLEKSVKAGIVGIAIVMVFMLFYYRLPGLFANIALVAYAIMLFAALKLTPSSLSLAGIAGLILSIGMAVDANILIFERTKEELKQGRSVDKAIDLGFDRAFSSIFDSNMTTLITCIILYTLGTGLIKGFAFSLALGVIVSFFTAIVVTRTLMVMFLSHSKHLHTPFLFGLKHLPKQETVQLMREGV